MALVAKAPELFKLGRTVYSAASPRIANLLRGKGFVKLTAKQAAKQAGRAKKITEQLAKKLDSKGIPQVPTAASKITSKIKPKVASKIKPKAKPKPKDPDADLGPVIRPKPGSEKALRDAAYTKKFGPKKITPKPKVTPKPKPKPKVTPKPKPKVTPKPKSKVTPTSRLASIKKFGKKWGPGIVGGTIGGLTGVAALNQLNKKKPPQTTGGAGTGGKPPKPTVKPSQKIDFTAGDKIRKERKIPKGALDASGDVKGLPSYFNNPIFKKEIKERGGRDKFEPDTMSGKMSRFGRIGDVTTNDLMAKTVYQTLDKIENKTAAEEKLQSELYDVAMKKKGGKVGKKKKKKQGYKSRKDESIAMRVKKKRTKKQLKSSRNESYGKWGKGKGKGKVNKVFRRGGGKALRGFGKATYSNKLY